MPVLQRGLTPVLHQMLDATKVVILEGGRSVGKTTLALGVAEDRGMQSVFDLSDPADFEALSNDAERVLGSAPGPILIDEAQLLPDLTVAIKRLVDRSDQPGQVLLTGSSRIGRGALGGGDPLAGRAVRLRLTSFAMSELADSPSTALSDWWTADPDPAPRQPISLNEVATWVTTGGLPPLAMNRTADTGNPPSGDVATAQRSALLEAYVDGVLTMNLAGSRVDRDRLITTFRYLASNPGQILNVSRAASELAVRAETIRSYLDLCASAFLLDVAPAVRPNQHQTVTAHPRVFASDVALAAWAADTSPSRLIRQPKLLGSLFENFVAHELIAQASWAGSPVRVMHWRDSRAKREVDLVLRNAEGEMLAFEVKSSSKVTAADAIGLQRLAESADGHVVRSFVIHTGRLITQLADHIWAVPVTALWDS